MVLFKITVLLSVVCVLFHMWITHEPKIIRIPAPYNISDLNYIIESDACNGNKPYLVVIVPSHPNHTATRTLLRQIYNQNFRQGLVQVVFMFGNTTDPEKQERIEAESQHYGDILQGDFIDSYRSISHLHLLGINWVTTFCQQTSFVMESDDDIFVNIKQILINIDKLGNGTYMYCDPIYEAAPSRNSYNKYFVSEDEYSGTYYPTYCNGWSIVYPVHMAHKLIDVVSSVPFFWMSDVYITGILPSQLNSFKFIPMQPNYTWNVDDLKAWMKDASQEVDRYLVGPTWGNIDFLKELHKMVGTFN